MLNVNANTLQSINLLLVNIAPLKLAGACQADI